MLHNLKSSTKYLKFVHNQNLAFKHVTAVPGVGAKMAERLKANGFKEAKDLLAQFVIKRNESDFRLWLKEDFGANIKQQRRISSALSEWVCKYLRTPKRSTYMKNGSLRVDVNR